MRFAPLTTLAAAALVSLGFTASASATVHTFNLSYSDTPLATLDPFVIAGNPGRLRVFNDGPGTLAVNGFQDGDSVSIDFTVGGAGLHLQDTGNPFLTNIEVIGLNAFLLSGWNPSIDNPNNHVVYTADNQTTLTITGYSGDLTSTTFSTGVFSASATAPALNATFGGNITNSDVWLTSFNITRTWSNIQFVNEFSGLSLPMDFTANGQMIAIDDNAAVPAPGALTLLGLGLLGFGGLRRRTATAI